MKDVMRFFQVGIALTLAFCAIMARAQGVSLATAVLVSALIVGIAYLCTRERKPASPPQPPQSDATVLDRYHYITMYHNGFMSIEELDAALTRCEIEEARKKALEKPPQNGV